MANILFLSHTALSSPFRVGSHHLSRAFSLSGHTVAHISTPYSSLHRIFGGPQKSRRDEARRSPYRADDVVHIVPNPVLPADIVWSRKQMWRELDRAGLRSVDYVFLDQPLFQPSLLDEAKVVFRPTDIFSGRHRSRGIRAAHNAHGVAATSPRVLESVRPPTGGRSCVIENGVDYQRFAKDEGEKRTADFIYVGALDERFDFEILGEVARVLSAYSFDIYGPRPQKVLSLPGNVRIRGSIPYADVPRVLRGAKCGIMPFTDSPSNAGRSPMKLYEYLSAGLPVVATFDIATRALVSSSIFAYPSGDGPAMLEALRGGLAAASEAGVTPEDRTVVAGMDWSRVARRLMTFAEGL